RTLREDDAGVLPALAVSDEVYRRRFSRLDACLDLSDEHVGSRLRACEDGHLVVRWVAHERATRFECFPHSEVVEAAEAFREENGVLRLREIIRFRGRCLPDDKSQCQRQPNESRCSHIVLPSRPTSGSSTYSSSPCDRTGMDSLDETKTRSAFAAVCNW